MMREILFRGKQVNNGQWVFGNLIKRQIWSSTFYVIRVRDDGFDFYDEYEVIPTTIGEYTSLCDKDGHDAFEGDILKASNGHVGWVKFWRGAFVKVCACHSGSIQDIFTDNEIVIGNIHDNPSLINYSASGGGDYN